MIYEESLNQIALVKWFRLAYKDLADLLVSYPAGLNLSMTQRVRANAMGLKAGMPDLMLLVPRIWPMKISDESGKRIMNPDRFSAGLMIEMKRKNGKTSDVQKEFHKKLRSQKYTIVVCNSLDSAQECIRIYLDGRATCELEFKEQTGIYGF